MKKTFALIIAALVLSFGAMAQTPVTEANYELAERFSPKKMNRMVYSTTLRPNWFANSNKFWYTWRTSEGTQYYIVDPVAKTKTAIFDMDKLAMKLTEITHDPLDAQHIPIQKLELKEDKYFTFEIQSKLEVEKKDKKKKEAKDSSDNKKKKRPEMEKKLFRFKYDIATRTLTDISDEDEQKDYPRWASISPDSSVVVYAKGYDLYYTDMNNLRKIMEDDKDSTIVEHRLTTDGTKACAYGGDDYKGIVDDRDTTKRYRIYAAWSPDSRHFVMNKYDMSEVEELWVIDAVSGKRPKLESYKYQMPGEPGPKTYTLLFNMEDKSYKHINVAAFKDQSVDVAYKPMTNKDRYKDYHPIVWLGGNDYFYLTRLSRDLHRVDVCKVTLGDDTARVVIEERLNTYIETRSLREVNKGQELIQWSERNGWAHLYLYSADGKLKNAITKGAWHVEDVVAVDEAARVVYFTAHGVNKKENPYYAHLYRINFDGTGMKLLNDGNFDNMTFMCDDAKFFVNSASRVDAIPTNTLYDNMGRKVMDLEVSDFSQLLMAGYKFPETFVVKAADGVTDLHGVMYKPFDFDSTKVYPIIEYVYPGPQTEATNYSWSKGMDRIDRLAQLGFVVITVGNRGGHPNRSKWYHNYGYGNLRDYGLEDQKVAAQQLAARYSFIDISRVGIHGHSGGGFMSTAAILTYPDFYKVAVSCAGNHDNSIYNRWWSETHHGVKEVVSEKGDTTFQYSIKKNHELAKNLKGRLLLVHGDIDDNVHPANTTRVVNALIRANKRFEMLYLPGQRHGFGDMSEYFFWRMADFYSRYLLEDFENTVDIPQMNND